VDWLIDVMDAFNQHMGLRTVFFAVGLLDVYTNITVVAREEYQLLGSTCLHIASKCEDVHFIGVRDLASASDNM
jgi:hypothetical protein